MKYFTQLLLVTLSFFISSSLLAEVVYVHNDALGSPIMRTNQQGAVISRSHYKPFGETVEDEKDGVGYTGHLNDTDLGLTYMQARYYDPVIGRFYSNDPIGFTGAIDTFNRYSYVANNPYKYTDPTGTTKEFDDFQEKRKLKKWKKCQDDSLCYNAISYSSRVKSKTDGPDYKYYSGSEAASLVVTFMDSGIGGFSCMAGGCNWLPSSQLNTTVFKTFGKILVVGAIGLEASDFSTALQRRDAWGMADSGVDMGALFIGVSGGPLSFVFAASYGITDNTFGPRLSIKLADGLCGITGNC